MATDLNLHRKTIAQLPPDVSDETRALYERELANRERTWMYAYIIDRSYAPVSLHGPDSRARSDLTRQNSTCLQCVDPNGQALLDREGRLYHSQRADVVAWTGSDLFRPGTERDG